MAAFSGMLRRPLPLPALAYDLSNGTRSPATLVVYAHGLGSRRTGEKARFFFEAITARGWSMVNFDFTGHGESEGSTRDFTLTTLIADLTDVVEAFAPARARTIVIGSSLGGYVAAWLASRRPDLVSALVLIAPAFRFVPRLLAWQGKSGTEKWEQEGTLRIKNPAIDVRLGYGLVRDALAYDDALLQATLATPTLVFHGTADTEVPVAESDEFVKGANAELVTYERIEGGDHRLTAEKGKLLAKSIVWLTKRGIGL
jgi:alpha-beta hydrolase superfamily lysophospholipase